MKKLVIVFTACALVLSSMAFGQVSTPSRAFDAKRETLGPHFAGHNIVAIAYALEHSPYLKDKSQFESTAAYQARLAKFTEHTIAGGLMPSGELGFVLRDKDLSDGGYSFTYAADEGVASLSITSPIQAAETRQHLRDYVAGNAFNAKVRVSEWVHDLYILESSKNGIVHVNMKMSPAEARSLKESGRLLVVCHLIAPWILSDSSYMEPTIDSPVELTVRKHVLQVEIDQVWVFDQRTGRIIQKRESSDLSGMCDYDVLGSDGNKIGSRYVPCK